MATLLEFVGFETGGFEEVDALSGSPTIETTIVNTGAYSAKMAAASDVVEFIFVSSTVVDQVMGFAVYFDDTTPSSEYGFAFYRENTPFDRPFELFLETGGDLRVDFAAGASSSETVTTPFTQGQWHYIEVHWQWQDSGNFVLDIDGANEINVSGKDMKGAASTHRKYEFGRPASGNMYIDDIYAYETATETDFLGGNTEVLGLYQNTVEDGTDQGDALSQNRWDDAGDLPFVDESDGNSAGYTGGAAGGHTLADDADSNARPGPDGDPNVTGTIIAARWQYRMDRGNGGSTIHSIVYGHNGDTATEVVGLSTNPTNFFKILEASDAKVPTSGESFALGMDKGSGAREVYMKECGGCLLHVPAAGVVRIPRHPVHYDGLSIV